MPQRYWHIHVDTWLFTTAAFWSHPSCPSIKESVGRMCVYVTWDFIQLQRGTKPYCLQEKMLIMSSEINYTHIFILYVVRKVKQGFGSGSS